MNRSVAKLFFISTALLFITACKNDKDDITNDINKAGSIESAVTVEHLSDTSDVLITKHKIWSKFNVSKEVYYRDTIPALGYMDSKAENEEGETKNVNVKKDYEIYITVK